jgi:hypothetical protein
MPVRQLFVGAAHPDSPDHCPVVYYRPRIELSIRSKRNDVLWQ